MPELRIESHNSVPEDIERAFYPERIEHLELLTGGNVNKTLLIIDGTGTKSILQQIGPNEIDATIAEDMAADYEVVTNHLERDDYHWEVARIRRTADGGTHHQDEATGSIWRSFTYIESEKVEAGASTLLESSVALSGLLGSLHNTLGTLDYVPRRVMPNFHEPRHYARELAVLYPALPKDVPIRALANQAIVFAQGAAIPEWPQQIIHGDPKLANALYRGGKPFTFIDFDTLMRANPLVDVGDMLRSVTGRLIAAKEVANPESVSPVIDAYYEHAHPAVNERIFKRQALEAGQIIAGELCMRYLIAAVDGKYFSWDSTQFNSSQEHNIHRANLQQQVREALSK